MSLSLACRPPASLPLSGERPVITVTILLMVVLLVLRGTDPHEAACVAACACAAAAELAALLANAAVRAPRG
ncbi:MULTISPECIES: hypothetical protein [Actinomadura]|uniref:Secreted protein n=1 Tax=Actinomadura yumaensis TaxID=111807 RepID=A0ABW2CR67_9ACTN|nr:hypothetical protein [Actinomadura sp. J1-007]MWK35172.1 hypothetical protein [Actinomadura sp. J1-007]